MSKYRQLIALLLIALLVFGSVFWLRQSPAGAEWLWSVSQNGTTLLPLVVIAALVDSINPCAFAILFVSLVFLFGIVSQTRQRIFVHGLAYIFGIWIVYLLIGLGILQTLHFFNVPHFMAVVGAGLLIGLGIVNILSALLPKFPVHFTIPPGINASINRLIGRVSLPSMVILGALVGLCEFPCTGGPYLTVLGLLHDTNTYWRGAGYLLLYNLIFVVPLVLILLIASNRAVVEKVQAFQRSNRRWIRLVAGSLMVILALVILFL